MGKEKVSRRSKRPQNLTVSDCFWGSFLGWSIGRAIWHFCFIWPLSSLLSHASLSVASLLLAVVSFVLYGVDLVLVYKNPRGYSCWLNTFLTSFLLIETYEPFGLSPSEFRGLFLFFFLWFLLLLSVAVLKGRGDGMRTLEVVSKGFVVGSWVLWFVLWRLVGSRSWLFILEMYLVWQSAMLVGLKFGLLRRGDEDSEQE
jgi:hypothetical protein